MEQYRVYLRAELGKLANREDASAFLASNSDYELHQSGMTTDATILMEEFSNQGKVDEYVDRLTDSQLIQITALCDRWRGNGVSGLLSPDQEVESVCVPVEQVLLRPAEGGLKKRFKHLGWRLTLIASDAQVLETSPYSESTPGRRVEFDTCLAEPAGAEYRLIDGMHRAIQLARNGESKLKLCVVRE